MFPYFEQSPLTVGPFTAYPFGALVAFAICLGIAMVVRRAVNRGMAGSTAVGLGMWMIIFGLVGSHIIKILVYERRTLVLEHPFELFKVWDGMSSFGGILGGVFGALCFMRINGVSWRRAVSYLDIVAYVFPFAWSFGRAGCSIAHDHPGIHTTSWLGVRYPDGPRFDLGLLELMYTIVIVIVFLALDRRRRPTGLYLGVSLFIYGPCRFWLDTLHVESIKYFGWSPDQYGAVLTMLLGLAVLISIAYRMVHNSNDAWPFGSEEHGCEELGIDEAR